MKNIPFEESMAKFRISHGELFNEFDKHSLCEMHMHEEIELLYINSGKIKYSTGNDTFIASAGDFVFINTKIPHVSEVIERGTSSTLIQFRIPIPHGFSNYLTLFLTDAGSNFFLFKKDEDDTRELSSYFFKMVNEYDNKQFAYEKYLTAYEHMIVAFLCRKKLITSTPKQVADDANIKKIIPALEYIDNNFATHITLADLSNLLHLNEQYICRIFKKAIKGTFIDYLNFVRICEAEKLLETRMSISLIADKVGFSSLAYFEKIFKKYKMCSPTTYRRIIPQSDITT